MILIKIKLEPATARDMFGLSAAGLPQPMAKLNVSDEW